jgi:putative phage-type endonuclease
VNKDLKIYRIPHHTDEWFEFRKNGIGGSEVGTVLGINRYDTNVRLFHEKIGTIESRRETSERMFWGLQLEDQIADIWSFYDGTKDGYVQNAINNTIIRKCRPVNAYIVNPKYPWLFASVDRLINIQGGFNLITGEPLETEAILECKAMSYWVNRMWDDGIPISYLAQIHQYMAILETDYAEIPILVDSGDFVVEKVMRDDKLVERILDITNDFWHNRVVPAREARERREIAEVKGIIGDYEKEDAIIQKLEPNPDTSDAYKDFMEENFEKERDTIDGTMELYSQAKRDNYLKKMKGRIDKERTGIKNMFIRFLSQNGAEAIDFGRLGMVSWSERKGSQNRTFNNRTKEAPDDEFIDEEFSKLNLSD